LSIETRHTDYSKGKTVPPTEGEKHLTRRLALWFDTWRPEGPLDFCVDWGLWLLWTCRRAPAFLGMVAFWAAVGLLGAMVLFPGCASLPTGASVGHTPKEIVAQSFADCHCRYHEVPMVRVKFADHKRSDGALAWGWAGVITVVRSELETWAMVDIEMVVGHEVAHAALGVWDEDEATAIASDAYYNAGCH